jgi:hypothetical protein
MARFALLLPHAADRYENLSKDEYGEIMQDYFAWVQEKVSSGVYVGGHKLQTSTGRLLTRRGGDLEIHDIASAEVAEVVGGIMIIEADNLDAAVELIRDHPHFLHNQNVMVLPVDPASEN